MFLRVFVILGALSLSPLPLTLSPIPSQAASFDIPVSTSTREDRLTVFDDVWSTINDRYYDRNFHGLDWSAQKEIFRSQAADAHSTEELYALLRRMISALNDPHTRVFAPKEKFDWWRPRFVTIGITVREIDGRPTVIHVQRDSAPERAGIRPGDVIDSVNGESSLTLIKKRLADLPASANGSSRSRIVAKVFDGPPETPVEISWRGKDGKETAAKFQRHWQQRDPSLRVQRKDDYAVVEIDVFTKTIAYEFARSLKEKLRGVRGVILDLRNNGGGEAQAMASVAAAFLKDGFSLGHFIDRSGTTFPIFAGLHSLITSDKTLQDRVPLIVLTSERSSSATEILVAALKSSNRARIIGTQTCGCVLAIRTRHQLPDGGLLDISELDYQTARGERLEGFGVKPDETVTITREDLYSGRDRAMELALIQLTKMRPL